MRFALILAGGSGTRLWPMSRSRVPKQLVSLADGRSLLEVSFARLEGLVESERRFVCAGESHRDAILRGLPGLISENFLGEPSRGDTFNAVAYATAIIARTDPDAAIAVFPADELIEPEDKFRRIVSTGYEIACREQPVLVTFGITPGHAATGYGYLQLGGHTSGDARIVTRFCEKPDKATAERWVSEGPDKYLWNSGIFVWKASTFLDCVRRYEPETHAGILAIARDWGSARFTSTLDSVYPTLKKISVEYAVMEKAARDPSVGVVAVPMDTSWADIGSWLTFARTCAVDGSGNARATEQSLLVDTTGTVVASDDRDHLITVLGCHDLIVVHTRDATLVCSRDKAEEVKKLQTLLTERFGTRYV